MSTHPLPPSAPSGARDLSDEVLAILKGRGTVTRAELDALFGATDEEYATLSSRLQRARGVDLRQGRAGGFVLKESGAAADAAAPARPVALSADEQTAVERVAQLLRSRQLSELVGDEIRGVLRSARRMQTGTDRPLRHQELAEALIIKHGESLLADPDVRTAIGKAVNAERRLRGESGLEIPGRWHPGKRKAIAFTEAAGFPSTYAGTPAADRPVDFEFLQGRVQLPPLEEFQTEVKDRMIQVLASPNGRAVVTLPTGAGKTRTAVEGLREWLLSRHHDESCNLQNVVLWLAHTEELCEQAYASFREVWEDSSQACPIYLVRFWGSYTADLVKHEETLTQAMRQASIFISTRSDSRT